MDAESGYSQSTIGCKNHPGVNSGVICADSAPSMLWPMALPR